MPSLPRPKAGLVACSGEELAEGTVTRLAALEVLQKLRPADTVTICLPLFLAGGEEERAFARMHPTVTVDGCELRCAARGTERYSATPRASLVVTQLATEAGLGPITGCRRLNGAGRRAVELTAAKLATLVDEALGKPAPASSLQPPRSRPPARAAPASRCERSSSTGSGSRSSRCPPSSRSSAIRGECRTRRWDTSCWRRSRSTTRCRPGKRRPGPRRSSPSTPRRARRSRSLDEPHRHLPHDRHVDRRAPRPPGAGQRAGDGFLRPAGRPG
ncbi:MAG: putative zinc-binding protein [Deltaproteobacteria bacterium]|nr:putative zinc-binding protein [Deltaproteobacteria bacterium]